MARSTGCRLRSGADRRPRRRPREGDDPDAILSRVQAAVSSGDLETALAEISALPEGAQAEMADWIADAEARSAVTAALETVTDAVAGAN
jgi:hypothetical protein